jgi:hypothetical protein
MTPTRGITDSTDVQLGRRNTTCLEWYRSFMYDLVTPAEYVRFFIQVPFTFFVILSGLISNILTYIILTMEMKPSSTSVLFKFLAVADSSVLVAVFLLNPFPDIYRYTRELFPYSEYFYVPNDQYLIAFVLISKSISVYGIVLITFERCIAVSRPHKAKSLCTISRSRKSVVGLVIFITAFNIPNLLFAEVHYEYDPCSKRMRPIKTMRDFWKDPYFVAIYDFGVYNLVESVIPFIVCFVLNFLLVRSLFSAAKLSKSGLQTTRQPDSKELRVLVVRVVGVVTALFIFEFPRVLVDFVVSYFTADEKFLNFLTITYSMMVLNSAVNFYIYFLTGRRFREMFWNLFKCKGTK